MDNYQKYSKCIVRSVNHIFKNFLNDNDITEVYETQAMENDPQVAVEIDGTISGEIVINLPVKTLDLITKKFINRSDTKTIRKHHGDVAGELANLITGTFANQLQYADHVIQLAPPEFNEDPIAIKALYDNINLSFRSSFGGFDIDLYYKYKG
ncbi:MAG TPA: chemotaxis protein CheX [Spirochaetota bacterium]|nr:chemotaxis protein CheX [Spirochaetota bacterium]HRZ28768.1 chemotaxis protein CheX [Spirochaetota bacterium]HSA13533.1 chemotaxis protein CheX [Spirochaetota bacterium]